MVGVRYVPNNVGVGSLIADEKRATGLPHIESSPHFPTKDKAVNTRAANSVPGLGSTLVTQCDQQVYLHVLRYVCAPRL